MALVATNHLRHGVRTTKDNETKVLYYNFPKGAAIRESLFSKEELERLKNSRAIREGEPSKDALDVTVEDATGVFKTNMKALTEVHARGSAAAGARTTPVSSTPQGGGSP
jgi:hypothetical protein